MKLETLAGKTLYSAAVEVREDTESYEEMVVLNKDLPAWNELFTEKLGASMIVAGKQGIDDGSKIDTALALAENYGGIGEGQTLYHGTYDSTEVLVLIWPWGNNVNVTLKKAIL